jgi:hypothetical protein
MAFKLNLPGNGTGAAPLPAGKSRKLCFLLNRVRVERSSYGRELQPPNSGDFDGALLRQSPR